MIPSSFLKALKPSLKHSRKHVLQLLRLYGDQALENPRCQKAKFKPSDLSSFFSLAH